ncbi:hypothetical protein [Virgibacillus salexigens]|uniref:Lipoprotein n=2 Tax=Virgibacillus TaxID=84406 RepID=A0A024QEA1_9BACI|nr:MULTISPECIES: hypothetical protein [Virgibacillus]GGJ75927.1 hypothetical protein GCM10007111_41820 [Virgibacillus kapii]CDQ40557.1 hypothetical protein BN990_02882 [Virgibacillus massiliensis]
MKHYIFVSLVTWLCFGLILSACKNQEDANNDYLLLMGESESWNLNSYEIEITQKEFKAGHGTLKMKNNKEYNTDSFQFETHAIINDEDKTVHSGSVSGLGIDIAEKTTGTIEGGTYLKENGELISLDDVNDIYMIIEWWNPIKNRKVKERIDLYHSKNKSISYSKHVENNEGE